MDPSQRYDAPRSSLYVQRSSHERLPRATTNDTAALSDGLNRLSLATASATPLPTSSPILSPRLSERRSSSQLRHVSPSGNFPAPRRTPSSNSLRDDRRMSTPSLQKRLSVTSLRSAHNSGGGPTSPRPSLSRRSSSNFLNSPSAANMRSKTPLVEEPPAPTASSIAAEYFMKEMGLHLSADLRSQTLVVIQDACYGHRFSRPRTSKAALSTIVERPERIRASILGLSVAFVRMGKRHAGEPLAPHPDLDLNVLPVPPFQIRKTSRSLPLNSPAVTHVHGMKWMDDLKIMCDAAESRLALNGKELVRPRSAGKDDTNTPKFHEGDLYLCSESLNAFQGALGGVCEGVDAVFGPNSTKRTFVCIRPPGHHCSSGHPSGFCWINNVHVGISHAAMTHGLTHAAIIDFDLHHGDGSQAIAWEQNSKAISAAKNAAPYKKTAIGYFSLHDINSYPCEMGEEDKVRNASVCIENAHGQSIWNVHLEPWKTSVEFWQLYNNKYSILLKKARDFLRLHTERLESSPSGPVPKAAVFISAGFDASEWEGAGMQRHKVNVPTDFYAKFTADIVRLSEEEGLGVDGRIISVLEGGYSDRALTSGVLSHISGLADARGSGLGTDDNQQSRLASEMIGRLGLTRNNGDISPSHVEGSAVFDTEWWAPELLGELEALVYPPPTPAKPREKAVPTFFSPTQSSSAKVITPTRDPKSAGSEMYIPPPLPEVDWTTAGHELSKILIPGDRQTTSCRPEDLNAEASRARRERRSAAEGNQTPLAEESRMQLRERKPKASLPSTPRRPSSRDSRRTTIGDVGDLPDPSRGKSPANVSRVNRRQSTASVVSDATEPQEERGKRTPSRIASNGRQISSRPGTATSTRPSDTMAMKKTRDSSGSRTSTPKRLASPKKAPPVPKVPASFLTSASTASSAEGESSNSDHRQTVSAGEETKNQDMDSLTAGVRKLNIKLKVPSPEENALREQRAAEERKKAASKFPRKPTGTKSTKAAISRTAGKASSTMKGLTRQPQQPTLGQAKHAEGRPAVKSERQPISGLHIIPPSRQSSPAVSAVPGAGSSDIGSLTATLPSLGDRMDANPLKLSQRSVSATMSPPLTPGTSQAMIRPQISVHSPPASVAQPKQSLPVFTSTGPIPFASPAVSTADHHDQKHLENRLPLSPEDPEQK